MFPFSHWLTILFSLEAMAQRLDVIMRTERKLLQKLRKKERKKKGGREGERRRMERKEGNGKGNSYLLVFPTATWVLGLDVPHIVLVCLILSNSSSQLLPHLLMGSEKPERLGHCQLFHSFTHVHFNHKFMFPFLSSHPYLKNSNTQPHIESQKVKV